MKRAAPKPAAADDPVVVRRAEARDLPALVALEEAAFPGDRMSRASFRALLERPSAELTVATVAGDAGEAVQGYALVLYRAGSRLARLYSIAVSPAARGRGLARLLLDRAEDAAMARGMTALRLEVRDDNAAAIRLYEQRGYVPIGRHADYYEDHADALRFEKRLLPARPLGAPDAPRHVPYHPQTTEFTCGPATLMMALEALLPGETTPGPALELAIWREATCVYLISAPGGCDPIGLALAAQRRGLEPRVHVSHPPPYFVEVTRGAAAGDIMKTAQALFEAEAQASGLPVETTPLGVSELVAALDRGALVILLVSPWILIRSTVPHWVLAYARTPQGIVIHDPYRDPDPARAPAHEAVVIPYHDVERMSVWGKTRLRAAIILERKNPS